MNEEYEQEIGRPLFLPISRTKQFRLLLAIVLGTFAFVAALFFGIGYIVGSYEQTVFVTPTQGLLT